MTATRTYKEAFSHEQAIEELKRCAGTQFDPDITDAFLALEKEFKEIAIKFTDEK